MHLGFNQFITSTSHGIHAAHEKLTGATPTTYANNDAPATWATVFGGHPIEYCSFIRAFENIIESRILIGSSRLYSLVQYTSAGEN